MDDKKAANNKPEPEYDFFLTNRNLPQEIKRRG
jgi:hypothetical protein